MTRLRRPVRSHPFDGADDERGSMAILLMVMLVGLMLSALLVPMIITQDRTTRFDSTRVQALDAAQAGIDVTVGTIRGSVTGAGTAVIGDSSKLPCGPVSGVVNSNGPAAYSVVVEYFTFDPVNEPYPSSNTMKCVNGYGTFDPGTGTTTPAFARFSSTGTVGTATNGSTAGRTITATYTFRTSNVNILGGVVQIAGSGSLCMDAGSAGAPAGTAVTLQPCSSSSPPAAQQVFAYRTNLSLQLVSSITAANPAGLCLNSAHLPALTGDAVVLSQCSPLLTQPVVPYTQQWSYNDNGQYQAALPTSATTGLGVLPDLCMNTAVQSAGQAVVLSSCSGAANWIPSPSVGPGAAALPQWVNYNEFGRCLDVTNQDPNHSFLIDYPCKQNPYPGAVKWNQLFTALPIPPDQASVTGPIYTNDTANGQRYCLTSPGSLNGYVTVQSCTGGALQSWTVYGGSSSLNYSTKYTVVNGTMCLGLSAPNAEIPAWSTIDVETCAGTTDQKWNAVPNVLTSTLKNIREH
ncbi:ricin-type beta-trefoil lectin domain protein [Nakamurella sp. PAMC28650]|uniref:ricin-type beta-trefoil lectin domain protein n=1 Tax=Nakamurella sp. PAMC28650 TaxID=2762325 RepID=UPI00164E3405|nr:ricin-type beta-trefoil lectin domain protein [Nakamurella sp. PAMC28650]QNK80360.1 ricin-type beta-trefoil lectin domain protein [Nakamurella sp. PAMC28650]